MENRRKYKIDSILTDWTPPEVIRQTLRTAVTSTEHISLSGGNGHTIIVLTLPNPNPNSSYDQA